MRNSWMLAGALGISATASASPTLQFSTVINQGDPIAGDQFLAASQVVVGSGGTVAMIADLNNSSNPIIIYSTPAPGNTRNNQVVLEANTPTPVNGLGPNQNFDLFDNLALSSNPAGGTRLSFVAANSSAQDGILQWDDNSGTTSLGDVAFDGDGKGYSIASDGPPLSGSGTIEMQVNASGQALFPATKSATKILAVGDVSSIAPVFTPPNGGLLAIRSTGDHIALATDQSAAALLVNSGINGVYALAANGSSQSLLSPSLTPVPPDAVLGYTSNNLGSAALMLVNGPTPGTQDIVLSKNGLTPQSILASPFAPPVSGANPAVGEMAPTGRIAMYIPNSTGDTIQDANAQAVNSSASVIASIAPTSGGPPATAIALDPSATNLLIEGLQDPGGGIPWVPQVNSNGITLFNAEIGTSASDEKKALLEWTPGDPSPSVILAVGDQLTIGGKPATIDDFLLNNLSSENDFYKNAISADNYLAISVAYTYPDNTTGTAVLLTQIPEPAAVALLPVLGISLLARRRHQTGR